MVMQQLGDILKKATEFLKEKGVSEPRLSAEWLLSSQLGIKRMDLYTSFDRPMSELELQQYRKAISRRVKHEPISYILEKHSFYGLDLFVNSSVLIPRHETEELVELVLKSTVDQEGLDILDLCTGSGAIACAIQAKKSSCHVFASDVSSSALNVAKQNAQNHDLNIEFFQSSLVDNIDKTFDIVVSNPPYIATHVIGSLEKQVKEYEPHLALDGGVSGLEFYEKLKDQLPKILKDYARIFLEIGFDQKDDVLRLFSCKPYVNAVCYKDSNMNHRFVVVEYRKMKD